MTYKRRYCYRIDFADGFTYFGVRSCSCDPTEDSGYMGSPVTHKAKWLTDIPRVKTIVSVHETRQLAMEAEDKLIEDFWAVSKPLSLNAAIHGKGFHTQGTQLTEEHRAKLSEAGTGASWYTDSTTCVLLKPDEVAPEGFRPGRCGASDETRAKMSEAHSSVQKAAEHRANIGKSQTGKPKQAKTCAKISKALSGTKWYTDGATNIKLKPDEVAPEGFKPGMTKQPRKQM